ncbi:VOC family protein [Neogemmobacter tilapiae]|uniref:Polyphosphate kinase n=1 Tax=Neogemmobacter tilapiae TaxID=875041 RepID=A0A918TFI7_9RHOB|nr:VOC family protein [Gemmobacter tilapiae]GHC45809.1 polyphosphate kinase [Gemmobacter tilapiae]
MTLLRLDHLAVSAQTLQEGTAWVEECLGVALAAGGKHAAMSTHNRLLSLGDLYLEVIAIDPEASDPGRARWFDLDRFEGKPRLTNWVVACADMADALRLCPDGSGQPMDLARGDLRWQMAVPIDGILPFDGLFPALIAWQGAAHPSQRLPDQGIRLRQMELVHPQAEALKIGLKPLIHDTRIKIVTGPAPAIHATFATPHGERTMA